MCVLPETPWLPKLGNCFLPLPGITGTTSATASNVMTRVREVAKSKDYPDDHSNFRNIELRYEVNAVFALTK